MEGMTEAQIKALETLQELGGLLGDAVGKGWTLLLEAIDTRSAIELKKLEFEQKRDLEWRMLYEARTREFQNIAMRLGDMVEKQYHTVR